VDKITEIAERYGLKVEDNRGKSYYDDDISTIFIDYDYAGGCMNAYCEPEIIFAHEMGHHFQQPIVDKIMMSENPLKEYCPWASHADFELDAWRRGLKIAEELGVLDEYVREMES